MEAVEKNVDLAVLGGGPGGYVAAIRAAQLGMKTLLVEQDSLGGVCLNWGCIPTKALLRSAEVLATLKAAGEFGLKAEGLSFDFPAVVARSRRIVEQLVGGVAHLMKKNRIEVLEGRGRLVGAPDRLGLAVELGSRAGPDAPTLLRPSGYEGQAAHSSRPSSFAPPPRGEATGEAARVEARHVIIATGAHPVDFPGFRFEPGRVLDARAAMSLTTVPESIVIVGGGSIGVEFAHLFHEFGAAVTIVELLPSLLPLADADQSKELERALRRKGVKILTSTKVLGCEADPAGLAVRLAGKKGEERLAAGVALLAAGVAANSQGLGLTEAGVALDPRGNVETDAFGRTSRPGVYAIGDVAGPPCLAHVASAEGILAVEHMAGLPVHPIDYRNIPACTYGTPEVASVGLTEKEAAEGGREVKVGRFPLRASGKALAAGESAGFVKVVLDAGSQELLGLHLVGAHASELLLEGSLARTVGAKAEAILRTVHPHPTLGESIHEAVADALGKAIHV